MNSIKTLATFFGWCTTINFGALIIAGLLWILIKESLSPLSANAFGITIEEFKVTFLLVLMQYRAAIIILNLVPYIALKIMSLSKAD